MLLYLPKLAWRKDIGTIHLYLGTCFKDSNLLGYLGTKLVEWLKWYLEHRTTEVLMVKTDTFEVLISVISSAPYPHYHPYPHFTIPSGPIFKIEIDTLEIYLAFSKNPKNRWFQLPPLWRISTEDFNCPPAHLDKAAVTLNPISRIKTSRYVSTDWFAIEFDSTNRYQLKIWSERKSWASTNENWLSFLVLLYVCIHPIASV